MIGIFNNYNLCTKKQLSLFLNQITKNRLNSQLHISLSMMKIKSIEIIFEVNRNHVSNKVFQETQLILRIIQEIFIDIL